MTQLVGPVERGPGGLLAEKLLVLPTSCLEPFRFSLDHPGPELDLVHGFVVLLASSPGEPMQARGLLLLLPPVFDACLSVLKVLLVGGDGLLGPVQPVGDVRGSLVEMPLMIRLCGPYSSLVAVRVVDGSEGLGLGSGQGGGDLLGRGGAGLDQPAAVIAEIVEGLGWVGWMDRDCPT